ncbi:MAG: hypothetical protein ABW170_02815 [Candidatus Thiodiazotropha sp. L084R]
MTRTAGALIGRRRSSAFWGLGCPKTHHEIKDSLGSFEKTSLPEQCSNPIHLIAQSLQLFVHRLHLARTATQYVPTLIAWPMLRTPQYLKQLEVLPNLVDK